MNNLREFNIRLQWVRVDNHVLGLSLFYINWIEVMWRGVGLKSMLD